MKKMIITHLLILCSMAIYGQRDLNGIYVSEWRNKIEINGNAFKYIIADNLESPFFYNDTLAECTFEWIDGKFIELDSNPPYVIAYQGLKVVQSSDSIVKDSIKISFRIPTQNRLKVSITTNFFKTKNLVYNKNNKDVVLPKETKSITFTISPEAYSTPHFDGLFCGVLYYSSIEYPIEKSTNRIDIEIPAIDDSFFEKYYVKGEYAKVSGDTITWKGEAFIKQ